MKRIFRLTMMLVFVLASSAFVMAQESENVPVEIGDTILLQGQLTDTDGNPIANATIEIWQADTNGNYNHPNDATGTDLLADFQYFGTTTTDENGYYAFLTVKPSPYEPRPTHIHYKVKIDGETVLTAQFYFEEDREAVEQDGVYGNAGDTLFLHTVEDALRRQLPIHFAERGILPADERHIFDADLLEPQNERSRSPMMTHSYLLLMCPSAPVVLLEPVAEPKKRDRASKVERRHPVRPAILQLRGPLLSDIYRAIAGIPRQIAGEARDAIDIFQP